MHQPQQCDSIAQMFILLVRHGRCREGTDGLSSSVIRAFLLRKSDRRPLLQLICMPFSSVPRISSCHDVSAEAV